MTQTPFRIAVLASTNGTDLQAIIDELKAGNMPGIELTGVISNKKNCYALQRAQEQGYQTHFIDPTNNSREEFDRELLKILQDLQVDLLILIGYMRILTPVIIQKYPKRIINVHPSLIPKYSGKECYGKSVHEAVLKNNEIQSGMTIHYIDEGFDTGDIIIQKSCPVEPDDNVDTLKEKVQALEKKWYPEVIRQIANSRLL